MTTEQLTYEIETTAERFSYLVQTEILLRTPHTLKMRLHIGAGIYIQIYHNIQKNLVNYVLVMGGTRIYGRDQDGGIWHRHTVEDPDGHDLSEEGQRPIALEEFLTEIEEILLNLGVI